jgi:hypothetical protein
VLAVRQLDRHGQVEACAGRAEAEDAADELVKAQGVEDVLTPEVGVRDLHRGGGRHGPRGNVEDHAVFGLEPPAVLRRASGSRVGSSAGSGAAVHPGRSACAADGRANDVLGWTERQGGQIRDGP